MSILYNSTLMVALALILFFGILWYFGVHKLVGKALDDRADKIRGELDEARRLREEAQELFADFERKQREVEGQAEGIVSNARAEAEAAAERAKADLATSIDRRLKAADEQIALAEANAVKEVKDTAVAVAIAAASEVLASKVDAAKGEDLIDAAIKDVGARLH